MDAPVAASGRFQLGAHTLPYREQTLDRALEGIAEAGYATVGIFTEHAGRPLLPREDRPARGAEVRCQVESFGLTPSTFFARPGAFARPETLIEELRLCSELGVQILQGNGLWPFAGEGRRKAEMAWFEEVEEFLRVLSAAAAEAERQDVTIALKPHRGISATGEDLVKLVRRIGSTHVRACWDAGNVRFYEGLDSEDDLEVSGVAEFVRSVCIKDHVGAAGDPTFPIPGDGAVDHRRLLHALGAAGFAGPLLVERVDQPTLEATDAALVKARSFLESMVRDVDASAGDRAP